MIRNLSLFIFIMSALLSISCVDDVDFDQAEEVQLDNEFELDLIYFTLDSSNFIDYSGPTPQVQGTVSEETRLEFLDDEFIQTNLQEVRFDFKYTNTFRQSFTNRAVFKDNSGQAVYQIAFTVDGSPDGTPAITTYSEAISGAALERVKRAISVEINADLSTNGDPINGELDFESKAYYRLIF